MFTGRKLALTLAFTAFVALAFGVSCRGFFTSPTLASITVNPTAPSIQISTTQTLQAYGLDNEVPPQGSYLTSGVSWSTSDSTIVQITGACATQTCGSATVQGVAVGTAQITASSQSVSNTVTATVYLGSVTNYEVCEGTFGDTTSCSSGSVFTWNVNAMNEVTQNFIAEGISNGTTYDLTTTSTWTVESTPTSGSLTCDNSSSPAVCTVEQGTTAGTYPILVTYGTGATVTVNAVVTN
jgi:Bacterial Ig-like domain (group 2)